MGIPKFVPWISKKFDGPNSIMCDVENVSGLYIDYNSVMHVAKRAAYDHNLNMKEEKELLTNLTVTIINYYKPQEIVYIAIDGPPPMAKIQQQRSRRYFSGMKGGYDSSMITPGTQYMIDMDVHIRKILKDTRITSVKKTIYSSHLVPGEGEHKIMKYLREHPELKDYSGNHVVYGNDSDLILLCIAQYMSKLYFAKNTVTLKYAEHTLEKSYKNSHINIDNLTLNIESVIGEDKLGDFIYACSLVGNDFIPKSPIMFNLTNSLDTIVDFIKSNKSILRDAGLGLFKFLSEFETFTQQKKHSNTSPSIINVAIEIDDSQRENSVLDTITEASGDKKKFDKDELFRVLWYRKTLRRDMTKKDLPCITNMCVQYVRMLTWVYKYYVSGHDSVSWLNYYPYHHAPMFKDLYAVLASMDKKQRKTILNVKPDKDEVRFTCIHQLLSVMPHVYLNNVPDEIAMFWSTKSKLIHLMPINVVADDDFASAFEDSGKGDPFNNIILCPMASYFAVMSTLANVKFTTKFVEEHSNTFDVTIANLNYVKYKKEDVTKEDYKPRGRGDYKPRGRGDYNQRDREEDSRDRKPFVPRGRGRGTRGRGM